MELANILNPFNIGPILFSVNIYSYLFPIKFLLMSIGFVILLGICLEKFNGKNPYGESLGEGSIISICIAVSIVLLFFYFVMNGSTDLESDSIGSEYKSNYANKQKSDRKIKEWSEDHSGSNYSSIKKEQRKLDQYEKNIKNIPINENYKNQVKLSADIEKIQSLEDENSKLNLELEKEGIDYLISKDKFNNKGYEKTREREKEEKINSVKSNWENNLNEINEIENRNRNFTKKYTALKEIKDIRFTNLEVDDPYFKNNEFIRKLVARKNLVEAKRDDANNQITSGPSDKREENKSKVKILNEQIAKLEEKRTDFLNNQGFT